MDRKIRKRMIQVFGVLVVQMAVFFIAAGRVDAVRGWIYFCADIVYLGVNGIFLLRRAPQVVRARSQLKRVQSWDAPIIVLYTLLSTFIAPYAAGADVGALVSHSDLAAVAAGLGVFALGGFLVSWAMVENKYFEGAARIQKERRQRVITTGPYSIVRHPGYAGMMLFMVSLVLITGSRYAVYPVSLMVCLFVVRTYFEDSMLRAGLKGYAAYSRRVRYRLMPGVW